MDERILARLGVVTNEEAQILSGRTSIDRSIYMNDGSRDVITGKKLLEQGKQITVRPHTRFVHFPEHTHDYVEVVYMCAGHTTHIVNGKTILLEEGSGSVRHEVRCVVQTGDKNLAICVDRKVPEVGTDDMAQWHILIEMDKNLIGVDETIVLEMTD